MKGLLIKDFKLLMKQKRFFLLQIALAAVISFTTEDTFFVIGYLALVFSLFSLSSISYDEYDNGFAFLFTLPISRKGYVLEKYCFGFLLGGMACLLALALSALVSLVQGEMLSLAVLIVMPVMLGLMLLVQSVMIPVQLKFGAEKGRVAMVAIWGGGAALLVGLGKLLEGSGVDLTAAVAGVLEAGVVGLILASAAVIVTGLLISIRVSTAIVEKKEF